MVKNIVIFDFVHVAQPYCQYSTMKSDVFGLILLCINVYVAFYCSRCLRFSWVYHKHDCVQVRCLPLFRAYSMSAHKTSDLFLPASRRLSLEAERLSSISPVTSLPWSNKLWLYPRTVAVTILVSSSEVLSGPASSSLIHSELALRGFCHLTTLNTSFLSLNESHTTHLPLCIFLLWRLLLLVLLLHPHVEEISNRAVYWASLLSSPKSALLLWKAVILPLVGSPYRQPQCMRETLYDAAGL